MSRLDLVVGPNGAGKSTFVEYILGPVARMSTFVNANLIAEQVWPGNAEAHAYEAAELAARARRSLIGDGQPLIAETVFSHESKLDLITDAHRSGYFVALHVLLVPVELACARVGARVAAGGHPVPVEKITSRYHRLWPLVAMAITSADTSMVWDNSGFDGPEQIALFAGGQPIGEPTWPSWTPLALSESGA